MIRLIALACGILCGIGLYIAALFQPVQSLHFLTPGETWDPTLGITLLSALIVAAVVFVITLRVPSPLFGGEAEPVAGIPSWKLMVGGMLFGLGWGLAGYFPSAAVVSLGLFAPGAAIFLVSALAGMVLHNLITDRSWLTTKGLRSGG
jgi:uncharacterized membrane protein YedE/YeeE